MKVGLDVGSTTIKCVVLDDADNILYSTYERHFSHILEKSEELLRRVAEQYVPGGKAELAISGSAGMGMADSVKVPFVQEVFATRVAANRLAPGTGLLHAEILRLRVLRAGPVSKADRPRQGEVQCGLIPLYEPLCLLSSDVGPSAG